MPQSDLKQHGPSGRPPHLSQGWLWPLALLSLAWLFFLAAPATAAPSPEKRYNDAKAYYQKLLSTKEGKNRQNWLNGAKSFRSLYQKNPDHAVAPKSLFMLGTIYAALHERSSKADDLSEAISYFEDLATLYPGHTLADDSLYLAGNLYLNRKSDPQKAARTFAKIVVLYPAGDMTSGAAEQLHRLKGLDYVSSLASKANERAAASQPPSGEQCQKAEVLPIRHWSNKNYTRVVIETTTPVTFRHQVLEKNGDRPRRLYIDLVNCRISPQVQQTLPIDDGLLKQVRNAQFTPDTVRVVFDTQADISDYKVFSLDDPFRIVVDVRSNEASAAASSAKSKEAARESQETKGKGKEAKPGALPTLAQQLGLGVKRVVIDPGHGGKDPGAVSPSGVKEKDVTLAVGKRLAQELRSRGYEVILTRDRDIFIPLEERTAIANSKEADLFLSIHVNAAPNHAAKGIETYVLDLATNKEAMRVAALENASSTKNISDLQAILLDLMHNSKLNESVKLAELVQTAMVEGVNRDYGQVNNLGVKKAPFIVLVGAQMPAILTEIAFSSNPQEEERLRDERYLSLVAQQIAGGVAEYTNSLNLASSRHSSDK
ncbi:MAG: N-acetylmuramoyl-L-alanine amidase [Thermodesulfobacteriota bacterium]